MDSGRGGEPLEPESAEPPQPEPLGDHRVQPAQESILDRVPLDGTERHMGDPFLGIRSPFRLIGEPDDEVLDAVEVAPLEERGDMVGERLTVEGDAREWRRAVRPAVGPGVELDLHRDSVVFVRSPQRGSHGRRQLGPGCAAGDDHDGIVVVGLVTDPEHVHRTLGAHRLEFAERAPPVVPPGEQLDRDGRRFGIVGAGDQHRLQRLGAFHERPHQRGLLAPGAQVVECRQGLLHDAAPGRLDHRSVDGAVTDLAGEVGDQG